MSSIIICITKIEKNGYIPLTTEMALYFILMQGYNIIRGYEKNPELPVANRTTTDKVTVKI